MTRTSTSYGRQFGHYWRSVLCLVVVLPLSVSTVHALPRSISGSIRLDASNGETDGVDQSSLNQRYSLNWQRRLFPYLHSRLSFSYDRIGTTTGSADEVWREQIRPVAELLWSHPDVLTNLLVSRHQTNSIDRTTSVVRENLGLRISTRSVRRPQLTLQYDATNIYNRFDRADRDTREDRYQAAVSHALGHHRFYYTFLFRDYNLRSSDVKSREYNHQFSWDQTSRPLTEKLRLASAYRFNLRRETLTYGNAAEAYWPIPPVAALYAEDATPDLSTLDPVEGLSDGNTTDPASPRIDVGEARQDHNIGVDLGFAQEVRGLYIYTDRPSGAGVRWMVYTSSDNIAWESLNQPVNQAFSTSFSRYEVFFPITSTRYIKAVSSGINEIQTVFITEIEALRQDSTDSKDTRTQSSHLGSADATYTFSEKLQSSANVSLRLEPKGEFSNSRDHFYYGAATRHRPWSFLMHSISAQGGHENFGITGEEQSNSALTYTVTLDPLETVTLSASASDRRNYINGNLDIKTKSAITRSRVLLLPRLTLTGDITFVRTEQPSADRMLDTWSYQAGMDAGLHRAFDAGVNYLFQRSDERMGGTMRKRHRVTADVNWRMTRTIRFRGMASRNHDEDRISTSQDYTATWQLRPSMSVSGLASIVEGTEGDIARRYSVLYDWRLNVRTSVTLTYTETDSGEGGNNAKVLQAGIRTNF